MMGSTPFNKTIQQPQTSGVNQQPQTSWLNQQPPTSESAVTNIWLNQEPQTSGVNQQPQTSGLNQQPQTSGTNQQVESITDPINRKLNEVPPDPVKCTIFPFPDNGFKDIDDKIKIKIRWPQLVPIGPYHRDKGHSESSSLKSEFRSRFLSRTESLKKDKQFYLKELQKLIKETRGRYSRRIVLPDYVFVEMMLLDGCFLVQLFREYNEKGMDDIRCPSGYIYDIPTLVSDLLKMENQLPFSVLKKLFDLNKVDKALTPNLPTLALKFLNQPFCKSSDVVNSQITDPKHLLDLFRSNLLPSIETYPAPGKHHPLLETIQSVTNLFSAGIFFRQNTKSLLDIDFWRKLSIPVFSHIEIPQVAIDDFTSTILVNSVAFEQCFEVKSRYFSAYVCFMNLLLQKTEDVEILRSYEIITRGLKDESCFRDLLEIVGKTVQPHTTRCCYLWKQFKEIHNYYNSWSASIWRNLLTKANIQYIFTIITIAVAILNWKWLFPEGNSTAKTSPAPSPI